jgi:hypothetical protein
MGLLTAPLSLVRAPVRLTFRVAEFGLSTAAEAARIATELLGGGDEPVVPPETGYVAPETRPAAPEPGEPEPEPDAPPAVPDELIPDHVDEGLVLVAEVAEEGAEDGAGAELTVEPPWDGYDRMTAADIGDRLAAGTAAEAAAVELYESTHRNRRSVKDAAERALRA